MEFAYAIKEVPVDPPKFTCCDQTSSLEVGHLGREEGEDGGPTDGSSAGTARGQSTSPPSLALSLSLSPEKTRGVSSPSQEEVDPPLTLLAPYLGFPIPRMVRNKCDKCPKPPSFRYFAVT